MPRSISCEEKVDRNLYSIDGDYVTIKKSRSFCSPKESKMKISEINAISYGTEICRLRIGEQDVNAWFAFKSGNNGYLYMNCVSSFSSAKKIMNRFLRIKEVADSVILPVITRKLMHAFRKDRLLQFKEAPIDSPLSLSQKAGIELTGDSIKWESGFPMFKKQYEIPLEKLAVDMDRPKLNSLLFAEQYIIVSSIDNPEDKFGFPVGIWNLVALPGLLDLIKQERQKDQLPGLE